MSNNDMDSRSEYHEHLPLPMVKVNLA